MLGRFASRIIGGKIKKLWAMGRHKSRVGNDPKTPISPPDPQQSNPAIDRADEAVEFPLHEAAPLHDSLGGVVGAICTHHVHVGQKRRQT